MKHIGKMKNNNAKIVVVYRTLPGDPNSALVVGTAQLGESYHNALMNLVQDPSGQQANEFAEILSVRKFPDGNTMLPWLHQYGHLKKVPTNMVIMTPSAQTSLALDELNRLIAAQKGVDIAELAITDEGKKATSKTEIVVEEKKIEPTPAPAPVVTQMSADELRSKADALFKEAQQLRKKADELDPPKTKRKSAAVTAE